MDFSAALKLIKQNQQVFRLGWNGKGYKVYLFIFEKDNLMDDEDLYQDYIQLECSNGKKYPWTPSMMDLLAEDWEIFAYQQQE